MLHKNRFRVGDGDGDGDGDYKGDDDGDGHGDGDDEEGDDANLNSSRSPPATQLAATRGNSRRHPSALVAVFSKLHGHCLLHFACLKQAFEQHWLLDSSGSLSRGMIISE